MWMHHSVGERVMVLLFYLYDEFLFVLHYIQGCYHHQSYWFPRWHRLLPHHQSKIVFWCACGVSWQVRQDVGLQALYFVRQRWYPETQAEGRRRPRDQRETPSTLGVGFYSYLKLDFVFRKLHVSSCDDHMLFMTWPVWPMYKEYI